ncbi:MAG: homocysteine S-methyltransferase family protein [Candidatus Krumholzibacteriota bacterium]
MNIILENLLAAKKVLLADGAMGTRLQDAGLEPGQAPESLNLTRPEVPAGIAAEYIAAGSDLVHTNSFGGSPLMLAAHGLADQCEEINRAAAAAAVAGAAGGGLVSGSIGPCGRLLTPYGDVDPDEVLDGFRIQAAALAAGGVDLLTVETMTDLREAVLAVTAAREAIGKGIVLASLTFEPTPRGWFTIVGNDPASAAHDLAAAGVDAVGSNCGQGTEGMLSVAREFGRVTDMPLLIQANAGLPVLQGGEVHYPETPGDMAEALPDLLKAGVRIIGGCCGTTPGHIAALRGVLDQYKG